MSLKAIHILFITVSVLLTASFGVWSMQNYFSAQGTKTDCIMGVTSLIIGVALIVYGRYFLKKLKHISYL
jgi:hypothetical protein